MYKVLIIINAEVKEAGKVITASPVTQRMVTALKQAISDYSNQPTKVELISAASLWSNPSLLDENHEDWIYCPLTIQLPDKFQFPQRDLYQACQDVQQRRIWVEQKLAYPANFAESWLGDLWLPIVLTAKGPLYGEVIGEGVMPNSYQQPVDLPDQQRQPLYNLAYQLLDSLNAPPSVYLLQFGIVEQQIVFDRLWPFPAAPAIASLKVQQPDLFNCHWRCLTGQPIVDLTIMAR